MKNFKGLNVQELDIDEAKEICGGKNILEYLAQAVGYVVGTVTWSAEGTMPPGSALAGQQEFVMNSGGMKI